MARLVAKDGSIYPIRKRKTGIGRASNSDIFFEDTKISRHHAQLISDGRHYYLVDNMSLNGTYVNDTRIDEIRLSDGDRIRIGGQELRFELEQAEPELQPAEGETVFQLTRSLHYVRAKDDEDSRPGLAEDTDEGPQDLQSLRASHRNLKVLQRLSRAIHGTLDMDKQLEYSAQSILNSIPGRMVSISLLDEATRELKTKVVHTRKEYSNPPYPYLKGLAAKAIEQQVCIAAYSPGEQVPEGVEPPGSLLVVPLWVHESVEGLIYLENEVGEKPYTEADLDLLIAMAGTIASAVQNSRLHKQVLEALGRINEQQRELLQSEKLAGIGALAAGVAHEINNQLTGIMGMAEAVQRVADVEKARQMGKEIVSLAESATSITRDLQNYARIAPEMKTEPVVIEEVLDDVLRLAKHSGLLKKVKVNRTKGETTYIMAEASRLRQTFLNLISNAVQAMDQVGEINISTGMDEGWVCVRLEDSGPGVPEQDRDRIFEPFYTTKKEGEGTGLGLTIVRNILSRFGGTITCENRPEGGAAFTVYLPSGENADNKGKEDSA